MKKSNEGNLAGNSRFIDTLFNISFRNHVSKSTWLCMIVFSTCICIPSLSKAITISIPSSADTYISNIDGSGDIPYGSGAGMWVSFDRFPSTQIAETVPLIRFDLSSYAGQTVVGTGVLEVELVSAWNSIIGSSQDIAVSGVGLDWDEATTTYVNWHAATNRNNHYSSSAYDIVNAEYLGYPTTVSFSIPSSAIQYWIDNPSSNFGVALLSQTPYSGPALGNLLNFSSREGTVAPMLTFEVAAVPVPAAIWLFASGLLGLTGLARRT